MKKLYINPEMEVVRLQVTATILAGSETLSTSTESVSNSSSDAAGFIDNGGSEDW